MLAHNLKDILTLVPEAKDMVKKASLEQDFPVDNSDSASASYLRVHYLIKVANKAVDPEKFELVKKAVTLYGTKDRLDAMVPKLRVIEKKANQEDLVKAAEAQFEENLHGYLSIEKTAQDAEDIYSRFGSSVTSSEVRRYAGRAWLNKEAAVKSLLNRFHATKQNAFVKVAQVALDSVREDDFNAVNTLCKTVFQLDKKAGLDLVGFNFYKEALLTKEADFKAGVMVNLAGTQVPYSSVERFGKERIASTMGKDIADGMTDSCMDNKAMLESLPMDLQKMLCSLVKGC